MDSMKVSIVTGGCSYVDHANDREDDDQPFQEWQQQQQISEDPLSPAVGVPEELPKGQNQKDELVTFPLKLHDLLEKVDQHGLSHIIGWAPHGRCFLIHQKKEFTNYILPRWFRQTQFPSFQRQLNIYHFKRITKGPDKGAYYHELFLRGKQFLCYRMQRQQVKGIRKGRHKAEVESEPDFYAMKPCKQDVKGSAPLAGQHTATRAAAADDSRTAAINNHAARQKCRGEPLEAFKNGTAAKNPVAGGIMSSQALTYFHTLLQANMHSVTDQATMLQNLQQAPVSNTIPNMGKVIQSILQSSVQADLNKNQSSTNQLVFSALYGNGKNNVSPYVMRVDALQQAQLNAMIPAPLAQVSPNTFLNALWQQNESLTNQQPPPPQAAYRRLQQQSSEAREPNPAPHGNVRSDDGLLMDTVSELGTTSNSGTDVTGAEALDNSCRTPLDSNAILPLSYFTCNVSNASDRSKHFAASGGAINSNDAQKLGTSQMNALLQSLQDFQVQNNYGSSTMNCRSNAALFSSRNAIFEPQNQKSQRTCRRTAESNDAGLLLDGADLEPRPFREDSGI